MDDNLLSSPPPLSMQLFLALLRFGILVNEQSNAALQEMEVTGARLALLLELYQAGKPMAPSELGQRLAVTRANISLLLTALEQKGLIERVQNKEDGRSLLASLTPVGEALLRKALPVHRACVQQAMIGLSPEEQAQMLYLAGKLTGALQRS